ncbi:putative cell wall proline rich protein [Aspergillus stella-maris]|uniref:putative cell wall proline rich protein n=1 Tax=Aspergillus stella-maris TaxID=1810926 RepID=UPI003CCE100E
MASISLPLQPQTAPSPPHYLDTTDRAPSRHRRNQTMASPLPNPPFIFPARDPDDSRNQDSEFMPNSRPALPAFSFNPGAMDSIQVPAPTPAPAPPVNRMSGHRRQYSEFVGGDQLVAPENTTAGQTNEGDTAEPPNLPPPGPGFSAGNRRRHAHRRSAAISSVDLTAISNALDLRPFTESAPGTPADMMHERRPSQDPSQLLPNSAKSLSRPSPPASPQVQSAPDFASSQFPTERRASNSGLLTEIPSTIPETPAERQPSAPARKSDPAITFPQAESPSGPQRSRPRPKTADASMMFEMTKNGMTDTSPSSRRPSSAAGHSRSHKSMSAGLLTAAFRKSHIEDDDLFPSSRQSSSDDDSDTNGDEEQDLSSSPASESKRRTKSKKRQKKVRSWAGSLLGRSKGKSHDTKKDDSEDKPNKMRPPALTRTNSDFGSGLDVDFDDDNIVVIRTPTNPTHPESQQTPSEIESYASLENAWKPRSFYEQNTTGNPSMSPLIDLDAALGPFNTPDTRTNNVPETGFSAATKRMYSGGRRGEFVGPEMRYHRRAESAPEMPPFDRTFLGTHRFPTTSSLENPDVFYEEEEDAFLAATSECGQDAEEQLQDQTIFAESKDNKSEDSADSSDTLTRPTTDGTSGEESTGLGIHETDITAATSAPSSQELFKPTEQRFYSHQVPRLTMPFSGRPKTPLDLGKSGDWHARIRAPPSPEVSPRFMPSEPRPMTSPNELSAIPPFSLHGGCSFPNSAFPSPDFTVSSEPPRSITTSSTTDPFPHTSMEDVPSLTSSASTMTNTLNRVSATFFQRPRLSTDRSASFSAAVHRRSSQPSSKRSSLASLSKLVVGPHAERSKLSHEEKPPGDEPEKSKRKGRRISRMMHFWRTKDKEKPNEPTVQD